ncbi:MAG: YDG domain-containing protein [Deltaproteobacteria bacterium]
MFWTRSLKSAFLLITLIMLTVVVVQFPFPAHGAPASPTKQIAPFKDVAANDPDLICINYISQKGIITGFPDGTYHPGQGLTRAQAAVVICKAAGLQTPPAGTSRFTDVPTGHWALNYISAAEKAGYLGGFPDGTFRPEVSLTRAQGISLVMRLCTQKEQAALPALSDMAPDHWAAANMGTALALDMIGLSKDGKYVYPDAEMNRGSLARALAILITKDPVLSQVKLQGTVSDITGQVSLIRNGQSRILKNGYIVTEGDQIKTAANSSARISYPDGTSNLLEAGSVMTIKQSDGRRYIKKDGSEGIAVDYLNMALDEGTIYGALATKHQVPGQSAPSTETETEIIQTSQAGSQIAALDGFNHLAAADDKTQDQAWYKTAKSKKVKVKVDMPWGIAAIRGTYVKITVNPDRTCRVSCLGGDAQLTGFTGDTVTLNGSDTASVKEEGDSASKEGTMDSGDKEAFSEVKVQVFFIDASVEQDVNQSADIAPSEAPGQTYQDVESAVQAVIDALKTSGIELESEAVEELQDKIQEQLDQMDEKTAAELQEEAQKAENQSPQVVNTPSSDSGSGEVILKPLSIADPAITLTKVYDGTTTAAVVPGTLSGITPGDSLTITAAANYNTADVGTGKTITVVYTITGANSGYYSKPADFTVNTGVITAKQLTISAPALTASKVYDGTTTAAVTAGTVSGVIAGDDVTLCAEANYDTPDAGTGKTITIVYSLTGSKAGNYIKPADTIVHTGAITAKQLAAPSLTLCDSKQYDGTTTAAVTLGTLSGVITGDDVTISAVSDYNSPALGSGKTITTVFTLDGTDIGNYTKPTDQVTNDGEITAKQLIISAPTLTTSKVYDGTTTALVTPGTLAGVVVTEDVIVDATADYVDPTVGSGKNITVIYSITGGDIANYIVPASYNTTGVITPKQLTLNSLSLTPNKTYDGTTTAAVSPGALEGVVGADVVTVSAAANYNDANAGTPKPITVVYTLDGAASGNYLAPVTYTEPNGTINKAVIDIRTITGLTAPATGQIPDTDIDATAQYTGTVTWNPADSPYKGSQVYTATITLNSMNYEATAMGSGYFTVPGATSTTFDDNSTVTAQFPATKVFVQIAAGLSHSLARRNDGTVVAWGDNNDGQCNVPSGLSGATAIAGCGHTLAIRNDGTVAAWGYNSDGQCIVPPQLTNGTTTATAVAAGISHSLALTSSGTVIAWGNNDFGQCNVPGGLSGVIAISAKGFASMALKNDGTVVAWGDNSKGQCNIPGGLSGVIAISTGSFHSLALKNDGTVVAWGCNDNGECNVPAGLSGVTAIAAGDVHSMALKNDGTVVAWGYNFSGQCNVPAGLSGVTAISAGSIHSMALKSDGMVVAWGDNAYGQCNAPTP